MRTWTVLCSPALGTVRSASFHSRELKQDPEVYSRFHPKAWKDLWLPSEFDGPATRWFLKGCRGPSDKAEYPMPTDGDQKQALEISDKRKADRDEMNRKRNSPNGWELDC